MPSESKETGTEMLMREIPVFRILVIAILLLASSFFSHSAEARENVVDYYRQLQQIQAFDLNYPLKKEGKGWVTRNLDWDSNIPVIVDVQAGYIFFSDEGTGGGNYETQIVLWRKSGGEPLIGISEVAYDPPYPDGSRLRFFEKDGKRWIEVTDFVVPGISISDFLAQDMTIGDLNALKAIGTRVYIALPRVGTTIRAYLVTKDSYANAVCNEEDWFVPGDPAPYLHYCKVLQNRVNNLIRIDWNKRQGQFTFGDKGRSAKVPWLSQ